MLRNNKLFKKILSGLSALAMTAGCTLPYAPVLAGAEPAAAHTINIFGIDLKQGAEYIDGDYVWQPENSNDGHKFVYNVKLSISGIGAADITGNNEDEEDAAGAGFIKVEIPAHILKDSSGEYADELELPVTSWDLIYSQDDGETDPLKKKYYKVTSDGRVYDTHTFVYYIDDNGTPDDGADDKYVIFNTQPISAGEVYEFPIAYITTKNTWDYTDMAASDNCKADLTINSWKNDDELIDENRIKVTAATNEIPVYIDTSAEIKSTAKKIEMTDGKALMTKDELPDDAKAFVAADADGDYVYAVWSVSSNISSVTQKYDLTIQDVYTEDLDLVGTDKKVAEHKAQGEIIGVKMGSGYNAFKPDGSYTVEGLTASGRRTDYVLVRYNKTPITGYDGVDAMDDLTTAPPPALYQTKNNVTVTLTPADGKDAPTSVTSSATYKYEKKKPEFHAVEDVYDAHEYGLYGDGKKRVSNKSNVTSYELEKLAADGGEVSDIKYETNTSAYSYGKTIEDIHNTLSAMNVVETEDGYTITAANRVYVFTKNSPVYTLKIGDAEPTNYTVPDKYFSDGNISEADAQRIAGIDIAERFYGQKALDYILDNKTFYLIPDVMSPTEPIPLSSEDYEINSIDYNYAFRNVSYDEEEMEFIEGEKNADPLDDNNILEFYVYTGDDTVPQLVGKYDVVNNTAIYIDDSVVSSLNDTRIVFKDDANVSGYQIRTTNLYFYVELVTKPSLTIKASDTIKTAVDALLDQENSSALTEEKIGIKNDSTFEIKNDAEIVETFNISGTDYIADIRKESKLTKKALGERTTYRGQDGKVYKSENDTLLGQYRLAWIINAKELAYGIDDGSGVVSNTTAVPVAQQSGVFYDLLPEHCDVLADSVNVYVDKGTSVDTNTVSLPSSSFTVTEKKNYNNSGRKLLIVTINDPCINNYTVAYCTIHTHDDIQDYGSTVLNTIAYQTGNPDIGEGFPDDGGNYAVTMSKYLKGLDPDNGNAKRFIYAESTEDILALFPTSSGIYKKVASDSDPTFGKTANVHNGDEYTYSIRMQNDSATKATDIAILDSVENYRTVGTTQYNKGLSKDRDWNGTIQSFDLKGLSDKVRKQLIETRAAEIYSGTDEAQKAAALAQAEAEVDSGSGEYALSNVLKVLVYRGSDIVDFEDENYSDSENRQYLLKRILREQIEASDIPENSDVLDPIADEWESLTMDFASGLPTDGGSLEDVTAFIIHINDKFILDKGDSVSFKVNMKAPETIDNVSELHYGDVVDEATGETQPILAHPSTYNNVYRSFRSNTDRYSAQEQENYTYFYTHYDYTQLTYSTVGDLTFTKIDSKNTSEKVEGATFSLTGISDYGRSYNETITSDSNGKVTFKDLERGRYTLIETEADEDHLTDTRARTVEIDFKGDLMIVSIDGDTNLAHDDNGYSISNVPRYHGNFSFRKVNAVTGAPAAGAVFRLSGTSDLGTTYNIERTSAYDGTVDFGDLDIGTYDLEELSQADGYMPAQYTEYIVKSSGTERVTFAVTAKNSSNTSVGRDKNGTVTIGNMPLAGLKILKVDSVSMDPIDGAVFTLTANSDMAAIISANASFYQGLGWTNTDGSWKLTSSAIGPQGQLSFEGIPAGSGETTTYTLTETTKPAGYTSQKDSYTVTIRKASNSERDYIMEISDADYVKVAAGGGYEKATSASGTFARIKNDPVFEKNKSLIKSWVGGAPTDANAKFPVLNLSSDQPEYLEKVVTIDESIFKSQILTSERRSTFLGIEVATKDEYESDKSNYILCSDDYNEWGETGKIYMKFNTSTNKVDYYTDSTKVYWPDDCTGLFQNCKSTNFKTFDLSAIGFDSGKITITKDMFNGCENLTTLNVSSLDTSKVTDMSGMFKNCKAITSLDLTNFETSNVTTFASMFESMTKVTEIKLDPTKFTAAEKLTSVNSMFNGCNKLQKLDLRGFGNCTKSLTINSWFKNCHYLKYIDLSNFSPSNITDFANAFNHLGMGSSSNATIDQNAGTTIYAKGKWNASANSDNTAFDYFRIRFEGSFGNETYKIFKNCNEFYYDAAAAKISKSNFSGAVYYVRGDVKHLDVQYSDSLVLSNDDYNAILSFDNTKATRVVTGYFNPAYKEGTTEFIPANYTDEYAALVATYESNSSGGSQSGGSSGNSGNTNETNTDFHNFTPVGEEIVEDTTESDGIKYTYEYSTVGNVVIPSGTQNVEVAETVTLIVKKTQDGKVYTQKYRYSGDEEIKAVWEKDDTDQWVCKFKVLDADAQMFAWENTYPKYECSTDLDHPITTKGADDDNAVITNVNTEEPVELGGLKVEKQVDGLSEGGSCDDEFEFTVTMLDRDDDTPYTLKPFNSEGKYTFTLSDGEYKTISDIPVGYSYTVTETASAKYTAAGEVTTPTAIVKDETQEVTVTNTLKRAGLTLTKEAELKKYLFSDPDTALELAENDADVSEWMNRKFKFDISFTDLIPGEVYTCTAGGKTYTVTGKSGTIKGIELKHDESATISGLPVNAKYTVTETDVFETIDRENELKDICTVKIDGTVSAEQSTGEKTLAEDTTVTFNNLREITKTETVDLSVTKEWYHEGHIVQWVTDEETGKPVKYIRENGELVPDDVNGAYIPYYQDGEDKVYLDGTVTFPSYLSVYLGYGLYDAGLNSGGRHQLLYQGTDEKQSLNVKNGWSYNYKDLPKYDTVVMYNDQGVAAPKTLNYVYYITESMPDGFVLKKDGDETLDDDLEADKNPYTNSDTSFYDSAAYSDMSNVRNSQEVTLKNQTIPTYKLTVGKLANGNFASRDKDFDFSITFTGADGKPMKTLVMTVEDLQGNTINPTRTITLSSGGEYSAAIPHNTKLIFKNVPEGASYTITDREADSGYDIRSGRFDFSTPLPDLSQEGVLESFSPVAVQTGKITGDVGYLFINTIQGEIPTGVDLDTRLPLMMTVTIGGWLLYLRLRRKKETYEEMSA